MKIAIAVSDGDKKRIRDFLKEYDEDIYFESVPQKVMKVLCRIAISKPVAAKKRFNPQFYSRIPNAKNKRGRK